jgi:hypothetical protein
MQTKNNSLVWIIKDGEPQNALMVGGNKNKLNEYYEYYILFNNKVFLYHKNLVYFNLKDCINASTRYCNVFVL